MPATEIFKCPKCEAAMTAGRPPNFTVVGGPGPVNGGVVVMSCPMCSAAFGTYHMPPS